MRPAVSIGDYAAERLSDSEGRNIVLAGIIRKTNEFLVTDT